jgi:hypothetical protein
MRATPIGLPCSHKRVTRLIEHKPRATTGTTFSIPDGEALPIDLALEHSPAAMRVLIKAVCIGTDLLYPHLTETGTPTAGEVRRLFPLTLSTVLSLND